MLITGTLLTLALAASPATDRYLAAEGIVVAGIAALPPTVDDEAWQKLKASRVPVAAQTSVWLNDKGANATRTSGAPGAVLVRAAATKTELAVLLEWDDASEDRFADETDQYGDAAAIEVPLAFGAGKRLPYVGMGDAGSEVLVHMVRAGKDSVTARHAVAAGFGSLTHAPDVTWMKVAMAYRSKEKKWRALFTRPLVAADHSVDAGLVPMAFALWDGAREQRGGHKVLSGWRTLQLPGKAIEQTFLTELSYGYGDGEVGDVTRGKGMVEAMCLACHRIGDKSFGPPDAAPELTNVGVYASHGYLRDSILDPSAVLVPNLNRNRHQDRSKPRDEHGAYPSAPLGTFGVTGPDGKTMSVMPAFAALPPAQLADMIAYLKSLGAPSTAPTTPTTTPGATP
jgi:complex iron-sulfur molybdoenzyme family reductase subunit gamma